MFKKAKKRIVISILAILAAVLVGTLVLIFLASYHSTTKQNYQVLEKQMQSLIDEGQKNSMDQNDPTALDNEQCVSVSEAEQNSAISEDEQGASDSNGKHNSSSGSKTEEGHGKQWGKEKVERGREVSTFFEIRILEDGTVEVIQNDAKGLYTDEELMALAQEVSSKTRGRMDDLLYLVTEKDGVTYICFMDNTFFSESFMRLFLFTLLFGLIAMIAIAFISNFLADRIVAPMEESYEKQKQFTADAGHELKTPVAVVAANLELLKREIGENEWLDNISYENERMSALITQLLELARNENREMERTTTDLSHLVQGAILPHEATAFEKNILIESEIDEGVKATVNEKSIEQLVAILLDNAISHAKCKEGELGKVTVKVCESKGLAVISVSNPGDEIPEDERKRLFERFYRTDRSRELNGHYGLGLAIAKTIADANHGTIEVVCEDGLVTFRGKFSAE